MELRSDCLWEYLLGKLVGFDGIYVGFLVGSIDEGDTVGDKVGT